MTSNLILEVRHQAVNTKLISLVALFIAFLVLGISLKTVDPVTFSSNLLKGGETIR